MKGLATTSLLIGACTATSPLQQVLKAPDHASEAWTKPLREFKQSLKSLSASARSAWDEVALFYPEALDQVTFFSGPKKHTRRPDSEWDHIVRGADVQSVWIENEKGEKEREVDGKLDTYDLRVKKVDPSILGIDGNVTQYSGYLDDKEDDKHLFYCISLRPSLRNLFADRRPRVL